MGSITFQVVGDASVGTRTKTYAVSDENINRLVAWASEHFGENLTAPQALLAWADWLMSATKGAVLQHERQNIAVPSFEAT